MLVCTIFRISQLLWNLWYKMTFYYLESMGKYRKRIFKEKKIMQLMRQNQKFHAEILYIFFFWQPCFAPWACVGGNRSSWEGTIHLRVGFIHCANCICSERRSHTWYSLLGLWFRWSGTYLISFFQTLEWIVYLLEICHIVFLEKRKCIVSGFICLFSSWGR